MSLQEQQIPLPSEDELSELPQPPAGASTECREALEHLAELLDHAMAEPDADLVRAHIEVCETCAEAADVEEHVRVLVKRACYEKAPDTLRVRIVTQLTVMRAVQKALRGAQEQLWDHRWSHQHTREYP